jgi:hypothetical protein
MKAPRWMGLVAALLALGGGTGCPAEPVECFGGSAPPQRPDARVFGAGKEVAFDVLADLVHACNADGVVRAPESVTVEVKDPENRPVPATAVLGPGGRMASIRFTGTVEGRHHVIVSFAPVGSLHQFGVFILADRRGEPELARVPFSPSCPNLDRTTRGTWVCGNQAWREPDAEPQSLSTRPVTAAVAGDVVWTVDGDTVRRYVDTGAGPLEPAGTAPYPPGAGSTNSPYPGPYARLATPDELVLLSDSLLHRYTFTESGGIATGPTTAWVRSGGTRYFGGDSVGGVLVRAGTRLLVVGIIQDPRTFESRTQACPFQPGIAGGYVSVPGEACQDLSGEPVGYEEGVVWTRTFDTSSPVLQEALHRFAVTGDRLVETGALALEGQFASFPTMLRPGPALPHLAAGTSGAYAAPRWNPETGRVELELTPLRLGAEAPHIQEHFIWMNALDGSGLVVYPRSSTR